MCLSTALDALFSLSFLLVPIAKFPSFLPSRDASFWLRFCLYRPCHVDFYLSGCESALSVLKKARFLSFQLFSSSPVMSDCSAHYNSALWLVKLVSGNVWLLSSLQSCSGCQITCSVILVHHKVPGLVLFVPGRLEICISRLPVFSIILQWRNLYRPVAGFFT